MQKNGGHRLSLSFLFLKKGQRAPSPAFLKNGRSALTLDIFQAF